MFYLASPLWTHVEEVSSFLLLQRTCTSECLRVRVTVFAGYVLDSGSEGPVILHSVALTPPPPPSPPQPRYSTAGKRLGGEAPSS